MHVVIVDEELPYPAVSGKRLRILNLVLHLARRHRVALLCHENADRAEAAQGKAFLQAHSVETTLVPRAFRPPTASMRNPRFLARLAANLASPDPYSAQYNRCPALQNAVARYAAAHDVDLWQCEWAPYAVNLSELGAAPWVMMAHDIQSLIWERSYRTERNPLKRALIGAQWRKYRRYEQSVFRAATLTITVTERDAALAQDQFGARRVAVVDNGVDVEFYRPAGGPRRPRDILFLGSLNWRANLDAVTLLLEQIFPAVLAQEPEARLLLVGRSPPEWLKRQVRDRRNVELHADPPDVRPFLHACGVMAVPLRIGGGSRLKILEALAADLPVVSTRVGAEGLHLEPGVHYVQADEPQALAAALVACIRQPEKALERIRAGRQVVERCYDWSMLADKMEQAWEETRASASPGAAPAPVHADCS